MTIFSNNFFSKETNKTVNDINGYLDVKDIKTWSVYSPAQCTTKTRHRQHQDMVTIQSMGL